MRNGKVSCGVVVLMTISFFALMLHISPNVSAGYYGTDKASAITGDYEYAGGAWHLFTYVTGTTTSYSEHTENQGTTHTIDMFVAKYDDSGNLQWYSTWDSGQCEDDYATCILLADGNVYVGGYFTTNYDYGFVMAFDKTTGDRINDEYWPFLWNCDGGTGNVITGLAYDSTNDYICIVGYTDNVDPNNPPTSTDVVYLAIYPDGSDDVWWDRENLGAPAETQDVFYGVTWINGHIYMVGYENNNGLLAKAESDDGGSFSWATWRPGGSNSAVTRSIISDNRDDTDYLFVLGDYNDGTTHTRINEYETDFTIVGNSMTWSGSVGDSQITASSLTSDDTYLYATGSYTPAGTGRSAGFIQKWDIEDKTSEWTPAAKWDDAQASNYGSSIVAVEDDNGDASDVYLAAICVTTVQAIQHYDSVLVDFDDSGIFQWAKAFGESQDDKAYAVVADGNDNCYIVGETNSYSEVQSNYATKSSYPADKDAFIAKYTGGGSFSWYRTWDYLGLSDCAYGITIYYGEFLYITGACQATATDLDAFILKIQTDGTNMESLIYATNNHDECGYSITNGLDANSVPQLYVAGYVCSNQWGQDHQKDVLLLEINIANGNFNFDNNLPNQGHLTWGHSSQAGQVNDIGYGISWGCNVDSNGNPVGNPYLAVTGQTNWDYNTNNIKNDNDAFVEKFLTNLNPVWAHPNIYGDGQKTGDDCGRGVWILNDDLFINGQWVAWNYIYATGYTYDTTKSNYDPFISKINPSVANDPNPPVWEYAYDDQQNDLNSKGYSLVLWKSGNHMVLDVAVTTESLAHTGKIFEFADWGNNVNAVQIVAITQAGDQSQDIRSIAIHNSQMFVAGYAYTLQLNRGGSYDAEIQSWPTNFWPMTYCAHWG
jgi:hypothetical protein